MESTRQHTHTFESTPAIGGRYRLSFNGEPLYEATITKAEGCWAQLRIEEPLPGKHQHLYKQGDEYEIKVALYSFEPVDRR